MPGKSETTFYIMLCDTRVSPLYMVIHEMFTMFTQGPLG